MRCTVTASSDGGKFAVRAAARRHSEVQAVRMRWSIRNQILLPLVTIQVVAVVAMTLVAAALAARRVERQIIDRLDGVVDALGRAHFPYTANVLAQMKGLSGAHFVTYNGEGKIEDSTLPTSSDPLPEIASIPSTSRLESLGRSAEVTLSSKRYFAVPLRPDPNPKATTLLVLYPEASWRQARWEAALPPLALGGGTLLAMIAMTSWIAHRISLRLRIVQKQVARVASGDFTALHEGGYQDEIRELVRSINLMCTQLRDMQFAIRRSERTQILAQLAAGLAHQLRNSLTGARMSVQLHAKRYPPPRDDHSLEVALRQLAMTEEQVRGILSLGRLEPRAPAPCDILGLMTDVALLVGPSCEHSKVRLHSPEGEPGSLVVADPASLRAALLNLTINAIEAAGSGGEVWLSTETRKDSVIVAVSDTGPGPPHELLDRISEPFVTSKAEGVGLGLAIVQQVAAEHGGRLSWTRANETTQFQLTLPRYFGNGLLVAPMSIS